VFNVNFVSCLKSYLSRCHVGTHVTAQMRPAAVVLTSTLTHPSRTIPGHTGNTTLIHNVNSFAQVIPSRENKHHVGSPTKQCRLWWFSYMLEHMTYLAAEKLYIRNNIQYRLIWNAKKSVQFYVGSADCKVILYIHKKLQVMLARLQVDSVYVGSADNKVMRYIHNTRQYRLCWYAYKSTLFMLAAPAVRLRGTYTTQDSTGYVGTLTSRICLCWQRRQ